MGFCLWKLRDSEPAPGARGAIGAQGSSWRSCLSPTTQSWDTDSAPLFLTSEKSCHLLVLPLCQVWHHQYRICFITHNLHTNPWERPLSCCTHIPWDPLPSWGHTGVCDPAQWPTPVEVRGQTALGLLESLCLCPGGWRPKLSSTLALDCQLWLHVPRALRTKPSSP